MAIHVEPTEPLTDEAKGQLETNLRLARTLGAEIVATSGDNVVDSLLRMARRELVTQIVVGRSLATWLRWFSGRSLTDRLVAESGNIAVHVVPSEDAPKKIRWQRIHEPVLGKGKDYLKAVACVAGLGLLSYPFRAEIGYLSVSLLYLALTILGGFYLTRGAVLLLALLSALTWNFFFVPPQFTFQIHSGQDILLFFLLLLVATNMGQLTARLRALNVAERRRETRSFALYRFLDCLNNETTASLTLDNALTHASEVTGCRVSLILAESGMDGRRSFPVDVNLDKREQGVVSWAMKNRDAAGTHTQNLPEIPSLFLPVESNDRAVGVLRVELEGRPLPLASRDILMQMARLLGNFLERERLRQRVERAQVIEASQRLQKTLLDTVSHELKTPLAIILSALEQAQLSLPETAPESELIAQADRSAQRLLRNVNLLLDLSRFESGVVQPKSEYVDLHDLLHRLKAELRGEFGESIDGIRFVVDAEAFQTDEALLFQLLNQLLRNALGHTPAGTAIDCQLHIEGSELRIRVSDQGPGLQEDTEALFEAFSHGSQQRSKGLGLGLSIAKRICENLNGHLEAGNNTAGGARFLARLPPYSKPET